MASLSLPCISGLYGIKWVIRHLEAEGNQLYDQEQYEESIKKYTEAIELDPKNAVLYADRAAAHSKLGQHEPAIADALKAINLNPKYSKGYLRLAIAYQKSERYHAALAQYKLCLEHQPKDDITRYVWTQMKKCALHSNDENRNNPNKRKISVMSGETSNNTKRRKLASPNDLTEEKNAKYRENLMFFDSLIDPNRRRHRYYRQLGDYSTYKNETKQSHPQTFSNISNKSQESRNFEECFYVSVHCHCCDEHFEDFLEYRDHLKEHYDENSDMVWKCCDFGCVDDDGEPLAFKTDYDLIAHIVTHTNEKPFRCKIEGCSKAASRKHNLRAHWRKHHSA